MLVHLAPTLHVVVICKKHGKRRWKMQFYEPSWGLLRAILGLSWGPPGAILGGILGHLVALPGISRVLVSPTSWYIPQVRVSRTSWYLAPLGISYFLVSRTSWYLACLGISYFLLSLMSWYLVLPGISYFPVSRTS